MKLALETNGGKREKKIDSVGDRRGTRSWPISGIGSNVLCLVISEWNRKTCVLAG